MLNLLLSLFFPITYLFFKTIAKGKAQRLKATSVAIAIDEREIAVKKQKRKFITIKLSENRNKQ